MRFNLSHKEARLEAVNESENVSRLQIHNLSGRDDARSYQYAITRLPFSCSVTGRALNGLQRFSRNRLSYYFMAMKIRYVEL